MTLVQGIVAFTLIWWTLLFCVLPWGNRPSDELVPGQASSAPHKPNLLKKFIITTALSAVIWLVINGLIAHNAIDFYGMAEALERNI